VAGAVTIDLIAGRLRRHIGGYGSSTRIWRLFIAS